MSLFVCLFYKSLQIKTAKNAKSDCPILLPAVEDLIVNLFDQLVFCPPVTTWLFSCAATTGWLCLISGLPSPSIFFLHQQLSAKTKHRLSRGGEKKKELLLRKLHTAETGTSQTADLRSKVVGYRSGHSHRPPHTLGLGRKTIYLVFQLKCICGRLGVHVRGIDVLCTRGKRLQWPFVQCFRTHTLSWWTQCPSGGSIGTQRAWEGELVQTTDLHPSLTVLFNELTAAQHIPPPICTGLSGLSGTGPGLLNRGQRSPEAMIQC